MPPRSRIDRAQCVLSSCRRRLSNRSLLCVYSNQFHELIMLFKHHCPPSTIVTPNQCFITLSVDMGGGFPKLIHVRLNLEMGNLRHTDLCVFSVHLPYIPILHLSRTQEYLFNIKAMRMKIWRTGTGAIQVHKFNYNYCFRAALLCTVPLRILGHDADTALYWARQFVAGAIPIHP